MGKVRGTEALFVGGASVVTANVTKATTEKTSRRTVEQLVKECMTIVETNQHNRMSWKK